MTPSANPSNVPSRSRFSADHGHATVFSMLSVSVSSMIMALALIAMLLASVPTVARADDYSAFPDAPFVNAPRALITDANGNVLFSRDAEVSVPIASTTKIMTAVVAIESGIPLDTIYIVSDHAAMNEGSVAGYYAGEQITLRDMLEVMMIHSAGDAAVGIAECVAGSEGAFIELMNQKAVELGMTGTHYNNPDGLYSDNNFSNCRDLLTLARYAMGLPLFKSVVGLKYCVIPVAGEMLRYDNTNVLLDVYPGMQGMKTGFTYDAGMCFVGVANRDGTQIFFCLLGDPTEASRTDDMRSVLDWAYSKYPYETLAFTRAESTSSSAFAGCRFGSTSFSDLREAPGARRDALNGELRVVSSCTLAPEAFATLGAGNSGVVIWSGANGPIAARELMPSGTISQERMFSPYVAPLFYELDAEAIS